MMDYFEVYNLKVSGNASMGFYLEDVSNGYGVRDITGLDPVPAIFNSSSFARMDGEFYHSSRREKRNIVITLGYEPDYTDLQVHQLRHQLYNFFTPERNVWLSFRFNIGSSIYTQQYADIIGYVESFDSPLFTDDPKAVISIVCFEPDFFDRGDTVYESVSYDGSTFPPNPLVDIGYEGTGEASLKLEIFPDRDISRFRFDVLSQDENSGKQFALDYPFLAGDTIQLITKVGQKSINLIRDGNLTNILAAADPFVDWPRLGPGENLLGVDITGAPVPYKITYNKTFSGL